MKIIGIDPGVTGALALLVDGKLTEILDMPVAESRVSGWEIGEYIESTNPDTVVVEDTQPMPKNGSVPSFKLGLNTGIVLGAAQSLGYPVVRIKPVDWKRANGLIGKDKSASRYLASELWPDHRAQFALVKNDGRAEAALIARAHMIRYIQGVNSPTVGTPRTKPLDWSAL